MKPDDEYQTWLNVRRGESPPAELTDRIMSAVCEPAVPPTGLRATDKSPTTVWQRVVPYLVCSVAAMVLAVRLYSVVSLFLVASPDADVAMIEPVEENSHEP